MARETLFKCPKCGKNIDWTMFKTKEEMKKFHEDKICKLCCKKEKKK
jgi:hypothetical protein